MILVLHILIALASIISVSIAVFRPEGKALASTYGLTAATIASGTLLVLTTQVSLLHVCLSGLFYLAVVMAGIGVARTRLVRASQQL